jgi:hypothetical protein
MSTVLVILAAYLVTGNISFGATLALLISRHMLATTPGVVALCR